MKEYLITVPVKARGHQQFTIMAESEDDAVEKFNNGDDCEYVGEELEVTDLDKRYTKAEFNE